MEGLAVECALHYLQNCELQGGQKWAAMAMEKERGESPLRFVLD